MISVLSGKIDRVDRKETLRYLGYYSKNADFSGIESVARECEREILEAQNLKACFDVYAIVRGQPQNGGGTDENYRLGLGFAEVTSRSLSAHLKDCGSFVLFAATAGVGIDRLIARYNRLSPARAVLCQAMGAAVVEQWCDMLCRQFREQFGAKKSRFSCGYGDLPLALQRDIFSALSVTKHIGVTLSDHCFMTPTKSVTAIVGIPFADGGPTKER